MLRVCTFATVLVGVSFYLHKLELMNTGLNQKESIFLSHTEFPGGSGASPKTVFRSPDFIYFVGLPSSRVIFSFIQEELVPLHHVRYGPQEGEKGTEEVSS